MFSPSYWCSTQLMHVHLRIPGLRDCRMLCNKFREKGLEKYHVRTPSSWGQNPGQSDLGKPYGYKDPAPSMCRGSLVLIVRWGRGRHLILESDLRTEIEPDRFKNQVEELFSAISLHRTSWKQSVTLSLLSYNYLSKTSRTSALPLVSNSS